MTLAIAEKLLAIVLAVASGWLAGRLRWLGEGGASRRRGNAAFTLFVPALLFRTAARMDFALLPWHTLAASFVPVLMVMLAVCGAAAGAAPGVLAISSSFGNSVQIGIPIAAALFGEAGLAIHIPIVTLHALVLLSMVTTLVELDLARRSGSATLWDTLRQTVRNTVIHPVVLPVLPVLAGLAGLAGLAFNGLGLGLPVPIDEALVLLAVVLMVAAVPIGSNALIFVQRDDTPVAETTGAIVISTMAFALTAPLWLIVLNQLGGPR